jgi:hypothetical protein
MLCEWIGLEMSVVRDPWEVLAEVYGVERGAESIGGVIADRIGVRGPANRLEVEHMVSTLVGNRIVQEDLLSGRDIEDDPIVQYLKEGHGRGVLLVPEEWLGPPEPRLDPGVLTDHVIHELRRAFAAAEENGDGDMAFPGP